MITSVPTLSLLCIFILPLCDSIRNFTIERPNPLPPEFRFHEVSTL